MAVEDPVNLLLALTTVCAAKYLGAVLWRKRKLASFEYVGEVSGLNLHPVKSCGPIQLQSMKCTKHELGYDGFCDRTWMVVNEDGIKVTSTQEPKMQHIKPSIRNNKLCLDAPGMTTLELEKNPSIDSAHFISTKVHGQSCIGMNCGKMASDWISQYLNTEGLSIVVSTSSMNKRIIGDMDKPWIHSPTQEDQVTFAEVGVCNIASESSLQDLNSRLTNPVVMGNFRPSVVIKGSTAFEEDSWSEIKIGDTVLMRLLEPNPRCLAITVDPNGRKDPATEPLKTLRKFRKSPLYGDSPLFGITTAVDKEGVIKVGDPVYVLRNMDS